jgi:cell division protein FtsB
VKPGAGGISLGEYIAVGSFLIALVVVVVGSVAKQTKRTRAELKKLRERVERAERVGELVCVSVNRGLLGVDTTIDWSSSLLHRLLVDRADEISAEQALAELRARRIAVERAVAEVRLLTGNRVERLSALQQLTHRIGNEHTASALTEIASVRGFDGVPRRALLDSQKELMSRLIAHSEP